MEERRDWPPTPRGTRRAAAPLVTTQYYRPKIWTVQTCFLILLFVRHRFALLCSTPSATLCSAGSHKVAQTSKISVHNRVVYRLCYPVSLSRFGLDYVASSSKRASAESMREPFVRRCEPALSVSRGDPVAARRRAAAQPLRLLTLCVQSPGETRWQPSSAQPGVLLLLLTFRAPALSLCALAWLSLLGRPRSCYYWLPPGRARALTLARGAGVGVSPRNRRKRSHKGTENG